MASANPAVDVFEFGDEGAASLTRLDVGAHLGATPGREAAANEASEVLDDRQARRVIGRGEVVSIPVERVRKVVDKTGSGDLYAAGFLFGVARGMTVEMAGRLGSLVGAEIVCQVGARPEANLENLARLRGFIW